MEGFFFTDFDLYGYMEDIEESILNPADLKNLYFHCDHVIPCIFYNILIDLKLYAQIHASVMVRIIIDITGYLFKFLSILTSSKSLLMLIILSLLIFFGSKIFFKHKEKLS